MANALAHEKSPYLRQHHTNPVQWLPWGEEAFALAERERKPILLSIGYAACHWCHVMARESFENADTAALMNAHFVNVKVDREERPDVDAVYVRALQAMGQRAGWPLTMFLTPSGKPFWGGTYFPAVQKGRLPSFREVLTRVSEIYRANPDEAEARASEVVSAITRDAGETADSAPLGRQAALTVAEDLLGSLDPRNGGLSGAPKFPYPALLRFLWNTGTRHARQDMRGAVVLALTRMVRGGIFDQLGGGFARYATDAEWLVPHFEKMLYDNALLVHLIAEVTRTERVPELANAAERTIGWLLRDMRLPDGAFACSLEADAGGHEGAFYVWAEDEVDALLGEHAGLFKRAYGVTREGNFEHRNILNRLAAGDCSEHEHVLAGCREVLFRARARRPQPRRDEKVLADWNGLAIAALARAGTIFARPAWIEAARDAFRFVIGHMIRDGELCHSSCDGVLSPGSILDDHANVAQAAALLYEATGDPAYLERCESLVAFAMRNFDDESSGAFYLTASRGRPLVARIRDGRDTATPSGNGVMAQVLARLYHITGNVAYRDRAQKTIEAFAMDVARDSFQLATLLDASVFLESAVHIAISGDPGDPAVSALTAVALRDDGADNIVTRVDRSGAAGQASVCAAGICAAPVRDERSLREALDIHKRLEEEQACWSDSFSHLPPRA
jgi:uncharacterized protein YyaL (SSP411 family)